MTAKNTADQWGWVSKALHWLIALLILCLGVVGLCISYHLFPRTPKYFWIWTAHKSFGITVLALMAVRLGWRLYSGAPKPLPAPKWQHVAANATHAAIYLLAFAIPLSGWLYDSSSSLRPFKFFGTFVMPKLSGQDEALAAGAHFLHEWGFWLLIVLLAMHVGAAFQHHLFLKDDTLKRMVPFRN